MKSAQTLIEEGISALQHRNYYTAFPESPRAYGEGGTEKAQDDFARLLNQDFQELKSEGASAWVGSEVSPYLMTGLGIRYPQFDNEQLIQRGTAAQRTWAKTTPMQRVEVLTQCLYRIQERFFDLAVSTMHTTGQGYMMAFQASGPHANDRAMEAMVMGYQELTRYAESVDFVKPMGKFDLTLKKTYKPIPRGLGLVIGCSTFPTWNTVPGLFANLVCGNASIVKPHPKSILPIAQVVGEMQKVFEAAGLDPYTVQLAVDTPEAPVTKGLAEHAAVQLIDYTGSSHFGEYIESLPGKTVFTEKAGVNGIVLESVQNPAAVFGNIAFAASLYSGQMCTAPQNIFVPAQGIATAEGHLNFDEVAQGIAEAVKGLAENPKMGPFTLGAIQNEATAARVQALNQHAGVQCPSEAVSNPEFSDARTLSPAVVVVEAAETARWKQECFGPALFVIRCSDREEALSLAAESARELGAITSQCYTTDSSFAQQVEETMNAAFTPVSFNFTGAAFVNQHAAFSDFHVTGGNPSGNATFADANYVNRRFVWVGNRYA
ncbi:MAG: phenylacetic acid degradation protein PaaN [Bacteroidia bacterium]